MSLLVIPVFISHQGCPHRCIFCDQYTITGQVHGDERPVNRENVVAIIEQWLSRPRRGNKNEVQVAFYGGSFTGLPLERQKELLEAVKPYIEKKQVDFIRISTRPDYIDDTIINLLQESSVSVVELGIQSLDRDVLLASGRGHSVQQSKKAIRQLQQKGFTVGVQLMCGLPGDTIPKLMETARKVAALAPAFVRIYPTLVIKGSGLEKRYLDGTYKPLSLSKAVALSGRMKKIFDQHNIRVVRMGLQASDELMQKIVAGPYHSSFGELVLARSLFKKTRKILRQKEGQQGKCLTIAAADESVFRGPNNESMKRLAALGLLDGVEVVFNSQQTRNTVFVL